MLPNWLFQIIFWTVILAPVWFPVLAVMGFINFIDKLTAKPKAPPYVQTPEDKARALANIAKFEAMRQANAHHQRASSA